MHANSFIPHGITTVWWMRAAPVIKSGDVFGLQTVHELCIEQKTHLIPQATLVSRVKERNCIKTLPQGVHSRSHQPPQPAPIPQHAVSAE
jgi:hypothetical protein